MVSQEVIVSHYNEAIARYPKLNPPQLSSINWHINGYIDVTDDEGYVWDTFAITIITPSDFPSKLPILIETGNIIPKDLEWHNNGHCCVAPNAIVYNSLGDNLNLLSWIDNFAHPFLANFVYKKQTGNYANGEYAHYEAGIIQGYEKILNVNGVKSVCKKLTEICSVLKLGRNEKCFCNSGKKFKHCYRDNGYLHKFMNIPFSTLLTDLSEIKKKTKW